jgi:hypothetical protein
MKPSITLINTKGGLPETFEADEHGVIRLPAGNYLLTKPLPRGIKIVGATSPAVRGNTIVKK